MRNIGQDLNSQIQAIVISTIKNMFPEGMRALDGIIAPGSWVAAQGTVDVGVLSTASYVNDPTQQFTVLHSVQLATTAHGHQSPPVGGERVILLQRESGWLAIMEHGPDDTPGAPAGESWHTHASGSSMKMKNDGSIAHVATGSYSIASASVSVGPSGQQYSVVRTVDLNTLIQQLNSHVHTPGGTNTGPPLMPFTPPSGSSHVTAG